MRSYRHSYVRPDRYWYASAYRRAVVRTAVVVALSFLWYHLPSVKRQLLYSDVSRPLVHPSLSAPEIETPISRWAVEFSYGDPLHVQFVEYAGNVVLGEVGAALAVAGVLLILLNAAIALRRCD